MDSEYPQVEMTTEMIEEAERFVAITKVFRTQASPVDTVVGNLGEIVFAQYFFGDWRKHRLGRNQGESDFGDIEIKTSAYPFSEKRNLLVRVEYARKRKPRAYVQIFVPVEHTEQKEIKIGDQATLAGWATAAEVDRAPTRDFGSVGGGSGGYSCHYIPVTKLHSMDELTQ